MMASIMARIGSGSVMMAPGLGGGRSRRRSRSGPGGRRSGLLGLGSGAPGRRVDPALGVDQEGAGGRDLLAGGEPLQDREEVAGAGAEDDLAALEDARLGLDVDDLVPAG